MNNESLKKVIKDVNDNKKALISEIINAGINKEEFMGYVSGEILLINAGKKIQLWLKDNDPETYLLEMTRPNYCIDVISEVFSMKTGTPDELSSNTGVPKWHCLMVIQSMLKQGVAHYENNKFLITDKKNLFFSIQTVQSDMQLEKKVSAKK